MVNELKQVSLREDTNNTEEENKNSQATTCKNSKSENFKSVQEITMDTTHSGCNRTETSVADGIDTVTGVEGSEMAAMSCAVGSQGVESDTLELPMEVVMDRDGVNLVGDSTGVLQPVDCSTMEETDLSSHGITGEGPGRTAGGGRRTNSGRKAKE